MKRTPYTLAIVAILFFIACDKKMEENVMLKDISYSLCNSSAYSTFSISENEYLKLDAIDHQTMRVEQAVYVNCCVEKISVELANHEENTIVVNITDVGEICNCICIAQISYNLSNLAEGISYKLVINRNSQEYFSTIFLFNSDYHNIHNSVL